MAEKLTSAQKWAKTIQFQKEMVAMLQGLRKPKSKAELLSDAQTLIYNAWESSPAKALKLAKQALEMSADCADAYLILADLEARTTRDRLVLIRQGVEAGRRALGKMFDRYAGHFWMELDTRPFMRAMAVLAGLSWEIGHVEDAVATWTEMLRLNPNDNQGIRYALLSCLLELKRNDEADALLLVYPDDGSVDWMYGRALLAFCREGDAAGSRRQRAAAYKCNPHIPTYLLGIRKIPRQIPEYYAPGDATEAVVYAAANMGVWRKSPEALDWLVKQI